MLNAVAEVGERFLLISLRPQADPRCSHAVPVTSPQENKARAAAQAAEEAAYARTQADILRAMDAQAARVDEFKKQQLARAADVLKRQAEEKGVRDKALSDLYANKIAPEYFLQFGTSHR